jgi:hypothetical protein
MCRACHAPACAVSRVSCRVSRARGRQFGAEAWRTSYSSLMATMNSARASSRVVLSLSFTFSNVEHSCAHAHTHTHTRTRITAHAPPHTPRQGGQVGGGKGANRGEGGRGGSYRGVVRVHVAEENCRHHVHELRIRERHAAFALFLRATRTAHDTTWHDTTRAAHDKTRHDTHGT